jgi:hypothetical protein
MHAMKYLFGVLAALLFPSALLAADVLIIADEFPAMQYVADKLKSEEKMSAQVVWQTNLPPDLSAYSTVLVYIHRELKEAPEKAMITYAQAGGKLIVLHHSISSGKRKNRDWFKFLGVTVPEGDVDVGGYKWIEGVTQQVVNLAPDHFITTHKVSYPEKIAFKAGPDSADRTVPAVTLNESEVYLNHVLEADSTRKTLLGFKYQDKDSGKTYMQTHAGWLKPSGKGWIVYLQPGHSLHDLKNPTYERILLNALIWKP